MSRFNRILCPVDLSDNSLAAVKLATTIAKEQKSKLVFLYVAPQWLPEESMFESDFVRLQTDDDRKAFEKIRPGDPCLEYEHAFRHGNAGPEIVRESRRCDMVVMSTHGYGAMLRLVMGSVAQYTMRNAKCPVVMVRTSDPGKNEREPADSKRRFVTEVMRQVAPVREHDNIENVLAELDKANESAAPVVDADNKVIGVLTNTDIARYRKLQERFDNKDPSVIGEMFETDKYGHFRPDNQDFDRVIRHMSSPVVSISNCETIDRALEMFAAHQSIHHLVVVDEDDRPLGIVKPAHCKPGYGQHSKVDRKVDVSSELSSE